tara:strand:+ start:95 stop:358 length:264 start_codon:yes stop_codon:yes gene_type:complete
MPIYEFRCTECDEISEEILSFDDNKKTINCPVCNNKSERIMSLGSFHLKGAGWYKDGYGKRRKNSNEEIARPEVSERVTKGMPVADE